MVNLGLVDDLQHIGAGCHAKLSENDIFAQESDTQLIKLDAKRF